MSRRYRQLGMLICAIGLAVVSSERSNAQVPYPHQESVVIPLPPGCECPPAPPPGVPLFQPPGPIWRPAQPQPSQPTPQTSPMPGESPMPGDSPMKPSTPTPEQPQQPETPSTQTPQTSPDTQTPSQPSTTPDTSGLNTPNTGGMSDTSAPDLTSPLSQAPEAGVQPLASINPNMIGDTSGGGCGGLRFDGVLRVLIAHPTFGCSRLNIAENNSPVPQDRLYWRYNHFAAQSITDIFSDSPTGTRSAVDLDRWTFGFEKTFLDRRASVEFRTPINYQLTSDIKLFDFQGNTTLPLDDRDLIFGNLSVLSKFLFYRSNTLKLSGGVGVNIPTEQPVRIDVRVRNDNFEVLAPGQSDLIPEGLRAPLDANFSGVVENETVNLSPFLGFTFTPNDRFFSQGFLQVDVPLNESSASASGTAAITLPLLGPIPTDLPGVSGELEQQELMRMNLGVGYWVYRNPCARWITGWAPTIEAHYTTTLADAEILDEEIEFLPGESLTLEVGNSSNRVDVFNMTFGGTLLLCNRATLATGFVVPFSTGDNKPFDYEVTVQFNWFFGPTVRQPRTPPPSF